MSAVDAREMLVHAGGGAVRPKRVPIDVPERPTNAITEWAQEVDTAIQEGLSGGYDGPDKFGRAGMRAIYDGVVKTPLRGGYEAGLIVQDLVGLPAPGHEGAAAKAWEKTKDGFRAVKKQLAKGGAQNAKDLKEWGTKQVEKAKEDPWGTAGYGAGGLVIGVKGVDDVFGKTPGGGASVPAVKPAPKTLAVIEGKATPEPKTKGKAAPTLPAPKPEPKPAAAACTTCGGGGRDSWPETSDVGDDLRGRSGYRDPVAIKESRLRALASFTPRDVDGSTFYAAQDRSHSCGMAAMRNIIASVRGKDYPENYLRIVSQTAGGRYLAGDGTTADNLTSVLRMSGVNADAPQWASLDEVAAMARPNTPAIVQVSPAGGTTRDLPEVDWPRGLSRRREVKPGGYTGRWFGGYHFIVVDRVTDTHVHIRDPLAVENTPLSLTREEFVERYRFAGTQPAVFTTGELPVSVARAEFEQWQRAAGKNLDPDVPAVEGSGPSGSKGGSSATQVDDGVVGAGGAAGGSPGKSLTPKELDDLHPKTGGPLYHDASHSQTVADAHGDVLRNLGETDPKVIQHGTQTALVHDLDPGRAPGKPPKVSDTLNVLDADFNGQKPLLGDGGSLTRDRFGWTQRDLDVAKTQILRTQFPFDETAQGAYEKSLRGLRAGGMSDAELGRVMEQGASLSEISDKASTYYVKSFPEAMNASRGLAAEIGPTMTVDKLAPHKFIESLGKPEAYAPDQAIAKRLGVPFKAPDFDKALTPAQHERLRENQFHYERALGAPPGTVGAMRTIDPETGKPMPILPMEDNVVPIRKPEPPPDEPRPPPFDPGRGRHDRMRREYEERRVKERRDQMKVVPPCKTCDGTPEPKTPLQDDNPWGKGPPGGSAGAMHATDPKTGKPMEILPAEPDVDWWETGEPGATGAKHTLVRKDRVAALNKELTPAERRKLDERMASIDKALPNVKPLGARLKEEFEAARMRSSNTTVGNTNNAFRARANWREADAWVAQQVADGQHFTPEKLDALHRILGKGLDNNGSQAGVPRGPDNDFWMAAGGAEHRAYLGPYDVPKAVEATLEWATRSELPGPEVAGKVYERLVAIHPYGDGNGRTARFAADWILRERGYPPGIWSDAADPFVDLMDRRLTGSEIGVAAVERSMAFHAVDPSRGGGSFLTSPRR